MTGQALFTRWDVYANPMARCATRHGRINHFFLARAQFQAVVKTSGSKLGSLQVNYCGGCVLSVNQAKWPGGFFSLPDDVT